MNRISKSMVSIFIGLSVFQGTAVPQKAFAQEAAGERASSTIEKYVPQQLLKLMHAPEVQKELGLSSVQTTSLEQLFSQRDGDWFRSRNLPEEKQRALVSLLEQEVQQWLAKNGTEKQQLRAKQLEMRAQGVRMLLRSDVKSRLKLDANQQSKLLALIDAHIAAVQQLATATKQEKDTKELTAAAQQAAQAEQAAFAEVLRPEQQQQLAALVGPAFDTAKLERIYPMAPELVRAPDWINSTPLTLQQLRGKVVVVHFYAFQCINCQRNLPHYSKWFKDFGQEDLVIIGIQTPETPAERDITKVREAAKNEKIEYPVMVDLESKNWANWSNTMWPTVYVIDRNGYLRQWWQGELNWKGASGEQKFHDLIERLIAEPLHKSAG